jgi:hypothetical protein
MFNGNSNALNGTKEFLESNSLIAKIAFLILVLILFIFALRLGTTVMASIFSFSNNPYLVKGMVDARQMIRIPQDPNEPNSITITRSTNEDDGIEFTYSVWIFIDDLQYNKGSFRHIFHKGNDNINQEAQDGIPDGMNQPNNAPGLYLAANTNALVVVMNTFNSINNEVVIPDIPLNKWVCVQIIVENRELDVYINGLLTRRMILNGVPRQNYGDVFVAMNGGFSGYISDLRYFNSKLGTAKIQSIVNQGPNLQMSGDMIKNSKPRYLSMRWFFKGSGVTDEYN